MIDASSSCNLPWELGSTSLSCATEKELAKTINKSAKIAGINKLYVSPGVLAKANPDIFVRKGAIGYDAAGRIMGDYRCANNLESFSRSLVNLFRKCSDTFMTTFRF